MFIWVPFFSFICASYLLLLYQYQHKNIFPVNIFIGSNSTNQIMVFHFECKQDQDRIGEESSTFLNLLTIPFS